MNVQCAHRVSGDGIAMMFDFMEVLREKLPAKHGHLPYMERWPFQPARGTSADLPTRLADGLELESAPVLRPAPRGSLLQSDWVPRTDSLRNRIRLLATILRNRKEKVNSTDVSDERANSCVTVVRSP